MRITKVELKNFKRFTDLTIDGIPDDTRLVLLIGSNGSGKSSVFDAFEFANRVSKREYSEIDTFIAYTRKANNLSTSVRLLTPEYDLSFTDTSHDTTGKIGNKAFYGRTSLRQLPQLTRTTIGTITPADIASDTDRPKLFTERDNRFENDIEQISSQVLVDVFERQTSGKQITGSYIDPINLALSRIFDNRDTNKLFLASIIPPLAGKPAELNFLKGNSQVPYNYLSAGEKEVINILLNLLVRKDQFTDTVYFIDELDLHLNTRLQFNLLKELTENWIPKKCQLWTASHSLGFIDYARQYEQGVIIDFDDLDFDQPQTLFPQPKERLDVYDIAVPKETMLTLMQGKRLVVCENRNDQYYNLLAIPDTIFVGVNNSRDVFLTVKRDSAYNSIRDRDFIADSEIAYLRETYPNHHILHYYCFENYLYHPDNIAELGLNWFDRDTYSDQIRTLKNELLFYILPNLVSSRQRYEEFNNDPKLSYKDIETIVDDFRSDDFERFYKFFSMKGQHEKINTALGQIPPKRLVQTAWFRQQIEAILSPKK